MNIWQWVHDLDRELHESGRGDVATDWHRFLRACEADEIELMVSMGPGLLAAAEELDRPWLAVQVRHWLLQGRILRRNEGATALDDAVDALERAHRPDAASCPQAVCTTQDLSLCYGAVDGPGWANERLAVVDEAIAGIDPTWSCWECLAVERSSALEDLGRFDESLDAIDRVGPDRRAHGVEATPHHQISAARQYVDLGHAQRALDALVIAEPAADTEQERDGIRLIRIQALLSLGNLTDSTEVFDGDDETFNELIRHAGNHVRWVDTAVALVAAGALPNTWQLGVRTGRIASELLARGSFRYACNAAGHHVRLAVARGSRWVADAGLAVFAEAAVGLRFPDSTAHDIAALEALAASVPVRPLPVAADRLLAHVDDSTADLEQIVEWLEAATTDLPDDLELLRRWAGLSQFLGGERRALDEIATRLAADPSQTALAELQLGLLSDGTTPASRFEELAALVSGTDPAMAWWVRAIAARRNDDLDECRRCCREVLALDPEALNTRRLAAEAATAAGDHTDATRLLREVCDRVEPGSDDWELLKAATISDDWRTVRWSAARLGLEIDPSVSDDDPIDETWSLVEIRPKGGAANGDDDLTAVRTGPVTARILAVTLEHRGPQRTRDIVVFDAAPANQPPDEPEENWTPVFPEVHLLEAAGWQAWEFFGERPDDERWYGMVEHLRSVGWELWSYSPTTAIIGDDEGRRRPGVFGVIAAPPTVPAAELHAAFAAARSGWNERIVHPQLSATVDVDPPQVAADWDFWYGNNWV